MTYAMIILLTGYTMSYDLYFKGRDSQAKFKLESVRGFFDQRKNYQLTDAQAIYQRALAGAIPKSARMHVIGTAAFQEQPYDHQ